MRSVCGIGVWLACVHATRSLKAYRLYCSSSSELKRISLPDSQCARLYFCISLSPDSIAYSLARLWHTGLNFYELTQRYMYPRVHTDTHRFTCESSLHVYRALVAIFCCMPYVSVVLLLPLSLHCSQMRSTSENEWNKYTATYPHNTSELAQYIHAISYSYTIQRKE